MKTRKQDLFTFENRCVFGHVYNLVTFIGFTESYPSTDLFGTIYVWYLMSSRYFTFVDNYMEGCEIYLGSS